MDNCDAGLSEGSKTSDSCVGRDLLLTQNVTADEIMISQCWFIHILNALQ